MAHVEAGSKEWGLLGFYTQSSTWAQRLQQTTRERLGLSVLGLGRYDCKPWRTWIVWSGWAHGGIDDGGPGKLTLSAALSDPLLDFPEDVGHVEVPLPAPVTSAGGLQRAAASAMEELGPDARHGSSCPDHRKPTTSLPGPARRLALIAPSG